MQVLIALVQMAESEEELQEEMLTSEFVPISMIAVFSSPHALRLNAGPEENIRHFKNFCR